MLPNETVASGAPKKCSDCKQEIYGPKVMHSAAGHYIGYTCGCGPYSRESGYFPNLKIANAALSKNDYMRL